MHLTTFEACSIIQGVFDRTQPFGARYERAWVQEGRVVYNGLKLLKLGGLALGAKIAEGIAVVFYTRYLRVLPNTSALSRSCRLGKAVGPKGRGRGRCAYELPTR
jgi:hypothetical protein